MTTYTTTITKIVLNIDNSKRNDNTNQEIKKKKNKTKQNKTNRHILTQINKYKHSMLSLLIYNKTYINSR